MAEPWRGIFTILLTPFHEDRSLDQVCGAKSTSSLPPRRARDRLAGEHVRCPAAGSWTPRSRSTAGRPPTRRRPRGIRAPVAGQTVWGMVGLKVAKEVLLQRGVFRTTVCRKRTRTSTSTTWPSWITRWRSPGRTLSPRSS